MFPKMLGIFGPGFSTSLFTPSYRIPKTCPAGPGSSCCPSVSWLTQLMVINCVGGISFSWLNLTSGGGSPETLPHFGPRPWPAFPLNPDTGRIHRTPPFFGGSMLEGRDRQCKLANTEKQSRLSHLVALPRLPLMYYRRCSPSIHNSLLLLSLLILCLLLWSCLSLL